MKDQTRTSSKPQAEDFSKEAIKKSVFSEAIQHPSTLFPAAVAMLSGLYMVLVNLTETSFALCLGSGLVSLISFIYHYFVRGDTIAEKHVKSLLDQRRRYKEQQGDTIEERCRQAKFPQGAQAARELKQAYTRLELFLKEKFREKKDMTAQRFLILAEESYYQAVQFLDKALSLFLALAQMDEGKLEKELQVWEKELKDLEKDNRKDDGHKALVGQALQEKIRSHRKRLELFEERKKTLNQVLAQCEILEATLDSAYLEVLDLIEGEVELKNKDVAGSLERAVAAARRVEDRLRGLGQDRLDSLYEDKGKGS